MKIFEGNNTTASVESPKAIETGKGFLLNTQYYEKENIIPVPFEFAYIAGTRYALSLKKHMYLQAYSWSDSANKFCIQEDITNPGRYYCRTFNGYISGSRVEYLLTFEEKDGEITILNNTSHGDAQLLDIVDQNDTYIYLTERGNLTQYLTRKNKKTYATETVNSVAATNNYGHYVKVYSDDEIIVLGRYVNGNYSFINYNKTTNTATASTNLWRGASTITTAINGSIIMDKDSIVKIDDKNYGFYGFNIDNPEQPIDLYYVDVDTLTPVMQHFTIIWNSDVTQFTIDNSVYSLHNRYVLWTLETGGKKYLNVGVYNQNFENTKHIAEQGIYTFILDEVNYTATFTGYNQIDSLAQIHGMLLDNSKSHVIIGKLNAFQIVKFDTLTQKYENTNDAIPFCYDVGFDELDRIWYTKTDLSVHLINLQDAQSVQISFEKSYYEYTGSSITTYINFSALNYLNENFVGTFELVLDGPAIFVENNTKKLTLNYDGNGITQIAISITGASPITVYPKFIG